MNDNVTCRTLLGKKNLTFSIECLQSMINYCEQSLSLEVFEDGSLDLSDIDNIEKSLTNTRVITKKSRDQSTNAQLVNYRKCLELRRCNVMAIKLFDTMLYDSTNFFYIDSDIFFVKKFTFPDFGGYPIFMRDNNSCYTFSPLQLLYESIRVHPLINCGFMHFPKERFHLDLIEFLIGKHFSSSRMSHWWAEQTLWAMLSSHSEKTLLLNQKQAFVARHNLALSTATVCIHLVSPTRYHFENLKHSLATSRNTHKTVQLKTEMIHERLGVIVYSLDFMSKKISSVFRSVKLKYLVHS